MGETKRRIKYTLEYKMEAVRLVKGGPAVSVTTKILGITKASLGNWARLGTKGQFKGAGDRLVSRLGHATLFRCVSLQRML